MLDILISFRKRKYKYSYFYLSIGISFILAFFVVIVQKITNTPFVSILVLLSCLLNSNKETDALLRLNKFDTFRLTNEHILKLSLFLYIKRNKFFWFALFFSILSLTNFSLFVENVSLIILAAFILLWNFTCNKWSEVITEIHLIILIVLLTFNLGHYFSMALNGVFCSSILMLLMDNRLEKKSKQGIKKRFISTKTPIVLRHFIFGKWQVILCLLVLFLLPKTIMLFKIKALYSWSTTINFTGIFSLLIIFELLQDVNLENHSIEYNRLRLYKLLGTHFFKRILLSSYMTIGVVAVGLSFIVNFFTLKVFIVQAMLIVMLVLWYKFFEEKSLIEKNKPTWQLSYIRCWIPSTVIFLISFAPQIVEYAEKIRGY